MKEQWGREEKLLQCRDVKGTLHVEISGLVTASEAVQSNGNNKLKKEENSNYFCSLLKIGYKG
jgi:hypothetical protein